MTQKVVWCLCILFTGGMTSFTDTFRDASQFEYIQTAIDSAFATYGHRKSPRGDTNTGGRTSPDGAPDSTVGAGAGASVSGLTSGAALTDFQVEFYVVAVKPVFIGPHTLCCCCQTCVYWPPYLMLLLSNLCLVIPIHYVVAVEPG